MKNRELFQLRQTLQEFSNVKGKEFAYAIFKNLELIEAEIKIFEKLRKDPHPDYMNFENERSILCMTHAKKDENGSPVINNNMYAIENMEDFNKDMGELKDKYKEVLDDISNAEQEFNDFMEKETELPLVKVTVANLPDDVDAEKLMKLKSILA